MKKTLRFLIVLFCSLFSFSSSAQILKPVKWSFSVEDLGNNEYNLVSTATIEHGWWVYSQFLKDGGPIPTSFHFDKNAQVDFIGKVSETGDHIKELNEPLFDNMFLKKFGDRAVFKQKVKVKGPTNVKGYLEFMTCDDQQCLPPDNIDFNFNLKVGSDIKGELAPPANPNVNTPADHTVSAEGNTGPTGVLKPIKWTLSKEESAPDEWTLKFTATIDKGFHIYSQKENEGGPVPTSFHFEEAKDRVSLLGKTEEAGSNVKDEVDPVWDMRIKYFSGTATFTQKIKVLKKEGVWKGSLEFMTCNDESCLPPETVDFSVDLTNGACNIGTKDAEVISPAGSCFGKFGCPPQDCGGEQDVAGQSYLWIFLLGFGSGLAALFTPCVFPMIPLTVSFFTKGSQSRKKGVINALLYGFFIVFIYFLLSVPFLLFRSLSSDSYNAIATSPLLNGAFFILFVVFAFSFFGYYDISLPSSFTNKVDSLSGVGNIIGIFFMALTLAIVSFTCTGPFIGNLLGFSNDPSLGKYAISFGFTGFGLAFALPFAVFALFPSWLNSLPKSGGWLHTVKVVLGFIELIFAMKFLSNADLVSQWGFLKRELFLGVWAVLGLLLALYLFGIIRFKHDHKGQTISITRKVLGAISLLFAGYSAYGIPGNNLDLFSGFPPPMSYSFMKAKEDLKKFEPMINNYEEAIALAKKEGKPIMLDFTGWACVNCRKMEENVWPSDSVQERLREKYIVVSLYVDDRAILPEKDQYVSANGKKIRTVGNKWSDFQVSNIKNNSQPYYVLISPDEKILAKPRGYTPSVADYVAFLDCGLSAYHSMKK